jgi:non-heme chloroperoxidase
MLRSGQYECRFVVDGQWAEDSQATQRVANLKQFDVPTLIIHGDDDQIVPIGAADLRSAKLVKNAILKICAGAPHCHHGLAYTHQEQLNADLLTFLET